MTFLMLKITIQENKKQMTRPLSIILRFVFSKGEIRVRGGKIVSMSILAPKKQAVESYRNVKRTIQRPTANNCNAFRNRATFAFVG